MSRLLLSFNFKCYGYCCCFFSSRVVGFFIISYAKFFSAISQSFHFRCGFVFILLYIAAFIIAVVFFRTQKGMSNSNKTGVMTREMAEKRVININSNLNIWILCWIFQYFMCSVLCLQVWRFLKSTFIFISTSFLICQ